MKKIGYLGPAGTFSYIALEEYIKRKNIKREPSSSSSIIDLFHGFKTGSYNEIIVPIENSVEGSVNISLDMLVRYADNNCSESRMLIKEEFAVPVRQCLLAKIEMPVEDITEVFSHIQPLAQCQDYLFKNIPSVTTHETTSTAVAAEMVCTGSFPGHSFKDNLDEHRIAVIGSKKLAEIYDLKILAEDINDLNSNITRFVVISYDETGITGHDKTSIVFSTKKDVPGSLFEVLKEFAESSINLTRITSRPTKQLLGEYLFFIDFEGHIKDPLINSVIEKIKNKTSFYKFLGSYEKEEL
ncbi:MAG: prephenate dehydratase [bacterium]|nr:prephenate dehydratase [bacterium]